MSDGTNGVRIMNVPDPDPQTMDFKNQILPSLDTEDAMKKTIPATCFPAGSSLACSWDPGLAREIGMAVAEECKSIGIGMLFGPGLNTRRHPLCGRGFEYYSEDPCLAGEITTGYVLGLQSNEIAACVKHFVCNNSDYLRTNYDSVVDERALREIYLAAFERVIKQGKPAAVMGSYNLLNGVQACENYWLLTTVLRQEWGFPGMIISDSGAVKDHLKAFLSGLDYEMPHSKVAIDALVASIESGNMRQDTLDMHCIHILDTVLKYSREGKPRPKVDFEAHHALAQKAAAQSAVLLKNTDNLLPIAVDQHYTIAIIGSLAAEPLFQGTGCARVHEQQLDIPLDEIRSICGDPPRVSYSPGYSDGGHINDELVNDAIEAAKKADIAIVFAGAALPKESDEYNRNNMDIEPAHDHLIRAVGAVNPNTIVVLCSCEAVVMPWIDSAKAVLNMWYCGEGIGRAVADLLFGIQNPCGKLAVSMPVRLQDVPGYLEFPGENHRHVYSEGIFVGYRYYEKKGIKTLFPFGHGLSYTEFEYTGITVSGGSTRLPDTLKVSFKITNTGSRSGYEIAQLYVTDDHSRLKRPIKELKGFKKVFLAPSESTTVDFILKERDFAYYDTEFADWVVDSGIFKLSVGSSSQDIRLCIDAEIISNNKYIPIIKPDTHYVELFKNRYATRIFFDFLVEQKLINETDVTPDLEKIFALNFWGIAQHLDMLAPYKITPQKIDDLVDRMNKGRSVSGGN
jgi:beta-glucosidase